ncbi:hemagglutinin/amebocyte aggregation factor-like [Antedon mediterranea]|uniref:hemagglutinin/amebocyte aggregation factor-like n=1 Tax=Antedon mediterranea TaxID=105859 RepID=UPI003AF9B3D0
MKCTCVLVLFMISHVIADWHNDFDTGVNFECPSGQAIYKIKSYHDNSREDRVFEFFCKNFPTSFSKCTWTNYVNEWDKPFSATCPYNGVIVGANSYHDNGREDRLWKWYCCESNAYYAVNCYETPLINDWDAYHEYTAPSGYFIHGVAGYHDNNREDRRWQYNVCQIKTY